MTTDTRKAYLSYYYSAPLEGFIRFNAWIEWADHHHQLAIDAASSEEALALALQWVKVNSPDEAPASVEVFENKTRTPATNRVKY